jgi:hypothetical protein
MADHRGAAAAGVAIGLALIAADAVAAETRCWIDNGALVVPADFEGMGGDFILDTSQAHSQLHSTAASERGHGAGSLVGTLRIAGLRIPAFVLTVADLDSRTHAFPTNITGVLGADVLRGRSLDLRIDPCRISIDRRRALGAPHGERVRVRLVDGLPIARAAISDGRTSRSGWFVLDTASWGARISDATLSRSPPVGGDDRATPPARLRALSIAGHLFEQTPAAVMVSPGPGVDGSIGLDILRCFRVRLAPRGGWLEVREPPGAFSGRPSARRSGSWRTGCR